MMRVLVRANFGPGPRTRNRSERPDSVLKRLFGCMLFKGDTYNGDRRRPRSMIRVRPEDIYALWNSTGRPFTDHLDRLIRSSASVVGIVAATVSDNPRTNVADGGADTEVSAPATLPDRWGYFGMQSVWQYKAIEVSSLTDKQIAEEITAPSKQYVRDLLIRGYGYRFCICHDGTAERKARSRRCWLRRFSV